MPVVLSYLYFLAASVLDYYWCTCEGRIRFRPVGPRFAFQSFWHWSDLRLRLNCCWFEEEEEEAAEVRRSTRLVLRSGGSAELKLWVSLSAGLCKGLWLARRHNWLSLSHWCNCCCAD